MQIEAGKQPDADGWIEWAGGERPVPGDTLVDVRLDGGHPMSKLSASGLIWRRLDGFAPVTHYRLHAPSQPTSDPSPSIDVSTLKEGDTVPKKGDTVLLRGVVDGLRGHDGAMLVYIDGESVIVPASAIVSVEPRPLAVGDRVRNSERPDSGEAELRFIDDDGSTLVRSDGGFPCVWRLTSMVRA